MAETSFGAACVGISVTNRRAKVRGFALSAERRSCGFSLGARAVCSTRFQPNQAGCTGPVIFASCLRRTREIGLRAAACQRKRETVCTDLIVPSPYDCWAWGWPVIRYATVRGLSRLAGTEPHA